MKGKERKNILFFCNGCHVINKKQLIILLFCAVKKCCALSGTDLFRGEGMADEGDEQGLFV